MPRWTLALWCSLAGAAAEAQPTPDPAKWICAQDICTEAEAGVFASFAGVFAHGAALDAVADADRIAALEQQGLRRFEFAVREPALVAAELIPDPDYRPEGWTGPAPAGAALSLRVLASADGETFERVAAGDRLRPGERLLVTLRQHRTGGGATVTYHPARWTLRLAQRRVLPPSEAARAADPMPPALLSADADPADELAAETVPVPPVQGAAELDRAETDGAGGSAGADDLAAELQRELARVGCYRAAIDGLWGPASRAALARFAAGTGADLDAAAPSPAALVAVARSAAGICPAD